MDIFEKYDIFVEVILPLALPKQYTYGVPKELEQELGIGKRVEIQFGKHKIYSALICKIHQNPPKDYQAKPILSVLDEEPVITEKQLQFWEWMSSYYMCTLGEIMNASLPSYLKLDSESIYIKNDLIDYNELHLSEDAQIICKAFEFQPSLSLKDIQLIVKKKHVYKTIKELIFNRLIFIEEILYEKYQIKKEIFVRWHQDIIDNNQKASCFELVKNAPKQEQILLGFIDLERKDKRIKRSDLLKRVDATSATLNTLVEKRIFEIYEEEVDRITIDKSEHKNQFSLNEEQNKAIQQIDEAFQVQKPVLLHGITSSGKTLVYTQIIKNLKHQNQQILFLLPEIALTAQLIQRLQNWLGNIAVYHSKLSNSERVEIWNKVLKQEIQIIVGARSALLLPFSNLGLIIVDEEHDASYKQQEPNPRYHARDAALMLANMHKANVILGSATPSFESYFNARQNKYQLVELTKRYNDVPLPEIKFINYKNAQKEKKIVSGITFELRDKIQDTLNEKKQVVLFQNRRGYAPYLSCKSCDWIPMCKNCDVTLTYHKYTNDLRCHYCGYTETHISHCKVCGDNNLEQKGIGTERIEDDLKSLFPDAKIGRMDYDTVKTKYGHEKIIHAFEDGVYDILVGTQMVTKGLDFKNLQLVGVLNADALLYFPDFRAIERAYQLLIQVSGRAGRKDVKGQVEIQISNEEHQIVQAVLKNDFKDFYLSQISERKLFSYPPYSRLIGITIRHKDLSIVEEAAQLLSKQLQKHYNEWIKGPNKPIFQRINNYFIREILIKIPREHFTQLSHIKQMIDYEIKNLYQFEKFKNVFIQKDVDLM